MLCQFLLMFQFMMISQFEMLCLFVMMYQFVMMGKFLIICQFLMVCQFEMMYHFVLVCQYDAPLASISTEWLLFVVKNRTIIKFFDNIIWFIFNTKKSSVISEYISLRKVSFTTFLRFVLFSGENEFLLKDGHFDFLNS